LKGRKSAFEREIYSVGIPPTKLIALGQPNGRRRGRNLYRMAMDIPAQKVVISIAIIFNIQSQLSMSHNV
jgi:hypothetical protein